MEQKKFSGLAIAGFVLSFFTITSVLAIIFCSIALSQTSNGKRRGRGLAIAGLVISIINILFWLMILGALLG